MPEFSSTVLPTPSPYHLNILLLLLHLFNGFFQDNLGKPAPERQTVLDFTAARDDGVAMASDGPYANHLHLTPDR